VEFHNSFLSAIHDPLYIPTVEVFESYVIGKNINIGCVKNLYTITVRAGR